MGGRHVKLSIKGGEKTWVKHIRAYDRNDVEEGIEAFKGWWEEFIATYMRLCAQETDPEAKRLALPNGSRGYAAVLLVGPKDFGYVDTWSIHEAVDQMRMAQSPEHYIKTALAYSGDGFVQHAQSAGVHVVRSIEELESLPFFRRVGGGLSPTINVNVEAAARVATRRYQQQTGKGPSLVQQLNAAVAAKREAKGRMLEAVIRDLFNSIPGFSVSGSNVNTETEEIDLVVQNRSDDPSWRKEGPVMLVECKNWSGTVGKNEYVLFQKKLENRRGRASVGFLIATGKIAGTVKKEMLRGSKERELVVAIDGESLQVLVSSADPGATLRDLVQAAALT